MNWLRAHRLTEFNDLHERFEALLPEVSINLSADHPCKNKSHLWWFFHNYPNHGSKLHKENM